MIRPATAADLDALLDLEQAAQRWPWSRTQLSSLLDSPALCWVDAPVQAAGARAAALQGWLAVHAAADEAEILNLAVHPAARRQGHAQALLAAARAALPQARHWFLEVRTSNHAAQALYARLGFAPQGRRPAYYRNGEGGREDALCLRWQAP